MSIELVIFDCDGVLVDSEPVVNQVLIEFVAEFGIILEVHEAVTLFRGRKMAETVRIIEQKLGQQLPSDFIPRYRVRTSAAYESGLNSIEGIVAVLDQITLPFCVASNAPKDKTELALCVTGLLPYFANRIFSAYEVNSWKPEPALFLHAAHSLGAQPSNCVVVEDSLFGVQAAVAAGMRVLGYCNASEPAELALLEASGAQVFHRMRELPALLAVND